MLDTIMYIARETKDAVHDVYGLLDVYYPYEDRLDDTDYPSWLPDLTQSTVSLMQSAAHQYMPYSVPRHINRGPLWLNGISEGFLEIRAIRLGRCTRVLRLQLEAPKPIRQIVSLLDNMPMEPVLRDSKLSVGNADTPAARARLVRSLTSHSMMWSSAPARDVEHVLRELEREKTAQHSDRASFIDGLLGKSIFALSSGDFAIGPRGVEVGDVVVQTYEGSSVPFILRRCTITRKGQETWRLVGRAYIDGVVKRGDYDEEGDSKGFSKLDLGFGKEAHRYRIY
jgi:hypothetical protein